MPEQPYNFNLDDSRPARRVLICYALLYITSIVAALWQIGHPGLVLVLLGAALPLTGVGCLPRSVIPRRLVDMSQWLIAVAAFAWGAARFRGITPDLAFIEIVSVLSLCLLIGKGNQPALLGPTSLLLACYGGVVVRRAIYLPVLLVFLCLGMLTMYMTRTFRLAGADMMDPAVSSAWRYRLAHLTLFLGFWFLLVLIFPLPQTGTFGLSPVSFESSADGRFSARWLDWLRNPRTEAARPSPDGRLETETGEEVHDWSERALRLAAQESAAEAMDARDGGGQFSGMGKDLVFRVRSPDRFYWTVRLYDVYDGNAWTISQESTEERALGSDELRNPYRQQVEQVFSIEKNVSSYLPAAYKATQAQMLKSDPGDQPGYLSIRSFAGALRSVGADMPPTPWIYGVTSSVVTTEKREVTLPPGPVGSLSIAGPRPGKFNVDFSQRLHQLAAEVTAGAGGEYEKAMALRDYLRRSLVYTLSPPPIPVDREPVDYFVFENRKGFCIHFAEAMAAMAHMAGLTARFVTGYVPGNYNVLTGNFEVYEHHAHAWTMVHVPPYGWLTFDATPPAALDLEAVPPLLSKLWNPFKENISARPPEFTVRPITPARTARSADRALNNTLMEKLSAVLDKSSGDADGAAATAKAVFAAAKEALSDLWAHLKRSAAQWAVLLWARIQGFGTGLAAAVVRLPPGSKLFFIAVAIAGYAVVRTQHRLLASFRRWCRRRRCQHQWKTLSRTHRLYPDKTVRECCLLARELLEIAGHRRPGKLDLLEFAEQLQERDPDMAYNAGIIFEVFTHCHFGDHRPSVEQAAEVYQATSRLRKQLRET